MQERDRCDSTGDSGLKLHYARWPQICPSIGHKLQTSPRTMPDRSLALFRVLDRNLTPFHVMNRDLTSLHVLDRGLNPPPPVLDRDVTRLHILDRDFTPIHMFFQKLKTSLI